MYKKKYVSVYSDCKTGFFSKLLFFIGIFLFIFYGLEIVFSLFGVHSSTRGTILAFAILFLGLSFLLYFISSQFTKLANIAKEIESEEINENSSGSQE